MEQHSINSLGGLRAFAREFCAKLKPGAVVGLSGALGAGKTTLVQMIALELGINSRVTSPTFALVKEYNAPSNQRGIKRMYHIDLYRLSAIDNDLGFEEYFSDDDAVCFVEWAEKAKHLMPKSAAWVEIVLKDNGSRIIKAQ